MPSQGRYNSIGRATHGRTRGGGSKQVRDTAVPARLSATDGSSGQRQQQQQSNAEVARTFDGVGARYQDTTLRSPGNPEAGLRGRGGHTCGNGSNVPGQCTQQLDMDQAIDASCTFSENHARF